MLLTSADLPSTYQPSADDPRAVLNLLKQRGQCVDGMPADKVRRRLRLFVRETYISEAQRQTLLKHLFPK